MVEYWLDQFDEKPLEIHRNDDGFIQLKDTGDPLIDKWEEKIAQGEEPDLWEAFSPEAQEELFRLHKKTASAHARGGFTIADTMERVRLDARLQGLPDPVKSKESSLRFNTFGDGADD